MSQIIRRFSSARQTDDESDQPAVREWLVTNGLGGYASGTVSGLVTRRYHGLLIAALPAPLGRVLVLAHLSEQIRLPDGRVARLTRSPRPLGASRTPQFDAELSEFYLEQGIPVWRYSAEGTLIEKRIVMPREQNTVCISYRVVAGPGLRLKLLPSLHFRPHEAPVSKPLPDRFSLTAVEGKYEISSGPENPLLRMRVTGGEEAFTSEPRRIREMLYPVEEKRGYESIGDLWSPGYFRVDLAPGEGATLLASTETWETMEALEPHQIWEAEDERRNRLLLSAGHVPDDRTGAELILAADQFIIHPAARAGEAVRTLAAGDVPRTVIAGYHWFTDWGRDTMISLEGLALTTGRFSEAAYILRTFSRHIRSGLIPNLFPEGGAEGLYHTSDATLWFFHAIDRYITVTGDETMAAYMMPKLLDIIEHHRQGTLFGIKVDPDDGLLRQGQEGYQLTWMDAKVGDWVVTPRRGKTVEINALWYNALRVTEKWLLAAQRPDEARKAAEQAELARASFNRRFWMKEAGYLYDLIDGEHGDDPSCRPNQIFAVALPNPILDEPRWRPVVDTVTENLLTPVGLRSLAQSHSDYKAKYDGDLFSRDAAYHQGTVWAWLIGPYIDAWLKVNPGQQDRARSFLLGLLDHLGEACVGSISEIFDGEAPFTPRGCMAQAWSVAEVLRCWALTAKKKDSNG